jgi:hypothetical protein
MEVKPYIRYLSLTLFLAFIANKTVIRPWVLKHGWSNALNIIVLSVLNLAEAIMGTLLLTRILLAINALLKHRFNQNTEYWLSLISASIFVIKQELKIHKFGGRNVYRSL